MITPSIYQTVKPIVQQQEPSYNRGQIFFAAKITQVASYIFLGSSLFSAAKHTLFSLFFPARLILVAIDLAFVVGCYDLAKVAQNIQSLVRPFYESSSIKNDLLKQINSEERLADYLTKDTLTKNSIKPIVTKLLKAPYPSLSNITTFITANETS